MKQALFIGIDLGGTKCAVCLGNAESRVLERISFATGAAMTPRDALARMAVEIENLLQRQALCAKDIAAIGISCGGPLDANRGLICTPPNLPLWDNIAITDVLSKRFGIPAFLQNDANACALAEWHFGAGRGCQNMVFLTFGTGLGAGLILNGQLYDGTNGMAGEAGHIRLAPDGPVGYGKRGSFEGFCSGGGLRQLSLLRTGCDLTARELVERADAGNKQAQAVLLESARQLGRGLSILIDLLNPQRIVIGSVFARAERWFRAEMERTLEADALPQSRSVCKVVPSGLGEALGDVAALAVAVNGLASAGQ